ncbi:MAG: APC family permease [Gammaproteobacteria bacterium]|nr:APC family permease [Gammaproteobacteria bacterium]NNF49695.1 APC family permease [Woeseiaceae bacterium]MBT8095160.1 APC family permease [Gammaproteobacteria bacterium]MBT8106179.1 APC family permease [Gammaproteobacteria bacterium]NNK26193.1 APC family permease [Woeseiaceae bacterium]
MNEPHHHKRSLGVRDMTLFTVSAILLLDTLAASASIGVSSITWWILLGILFFIPYGLISAELGTTYPEQGGIYAWVRDAFGPRWGTRVTWLYWLNTAIWNGAILVLLAGVFAQIFLPDLSLGAKLAMAIALNWLVVLITTFSLDIGKWVPNAGAAIKIVAFAALIAGGVAFAMRDNVQLANDFSAWSFVPEWGASATYISTIIYGMLGFELVCSASEEMKDPVRDVPRAILWSGVVIFLAYLLGTFAILAAIPVENIDLVEGLVDTLRQLFGDSTLGVTAALVLGIMVMLTFFSNCVTWAIGCCRAATEAAIDGELPKFLASEHKEYGTPIGSAVVMGIITTLILLGYGLLATSNEDLFWNLFASSAVLFLLPYLGAIGSFLYMRKADADRPRPFRVPGGMPVATTMTVVCIGLLLMTILLFMYVPGEGFNLLVVSVAIGSILVGEAMMRLAERETA